MNLQVIELRGKRVLTTNQLAESYEVESKKLHDNFSNNRERYLEGKHFIHISGEDLKRFKNHPEYFRLVNSRATVLYLWTEKGALLHAKSLNTNKAWEVYEDLIEGYYTLLDDKKDLTASQLTSMLTIKLNEDVSVIKKDVEDIKQTLENRMTIDYAQQSVLLNIKSKRVEELHAGNFNDLDKRKMHSNAWSSYKKAFRVASYKDTLISEFEEAKLWLENWRPLI